MSYRTPTKFADIEMMQRPLETGAMAKYEFSDSLQRRFTGISRFDEPFTMFTQKGDYIYVPRNCCPPGRIDRMTDGFKCGFKHKIKPRTAEQKKFFDETLDLLKQGENFQVKAGTGSGKTVCALHAAAEINRPTLVIVTKDDLVGQWLERIDQFLDIPKNRIGVVQGDICDFRGKWIVVAMIHSICKEDRYPKDLYDYFGFVIWDECHRANADTFSHSCTLFSARLRLGLSATPKRQDGKEVIAEAHIGPVMVEGPAAPKDFKVLRYTSDWKCPIVQVKTERGIEYRKLEHTAGKCGHVINMVTRHDPTNLFIARFTKKAYDKGRHIMLFSDRLEQLQNLMVLTSKIGVPGRDMGLYVGSYNTDEGKKKAMTREEKEESSQKRIMFATPGALKEGTDFPWFNTLGLCSPWSDVEQMVGRIRREVEEDIDMERVVLDVDFSDSPVFSGYAERRADWYRSQKAVVKNLVGGI
jgi:superfamily II DNA or RNA helicase